MFASDSVPDVDEVEFVARYVVFRNWVRADKTVRPEAFDPDPHIDLSVTRLKEATEDEVWAIGAQVAGIRRQLLRGRADVLVSTFTANDLQVNKDPEFEKDSETTIYNPNHAIVIGWPEKSVRKQTLQIIAAKSAFVPVPTPSH